MFIGVRGTEVQLVLQATIKECGLLLGVAHSEIEKKITTMDANYLTEGDKL